jgi:hypothetical protein
MRGVVMMAGLCPLRGMTCVEEACEWWTTTSVCVGKEYKKFSECAVTKIASGLDDLARRY